jgi:hypothetical protein
LNDVVEPPVTLKLAVLALAPPEPLAIDVDMKPKPKKKRGPYECGHCHQLKIPGIHVCERYPRLRKVKSQYTSSSSKFSVYFFMMFVLISFLQLMIPCQAQ